MSAQTAPSVSQTFPPRLGPQSAPCDRKLEAGFLECASVCVCVCVCQNAQKEAPFILFNCEITEGCLADGVYACAFCV